MSTATRESGRGVAFGALAAAGCLWGTGFLFGKIALTELSVGHMLLYRFGFACIGLIPVILWQRITVPRRGDVGLLAIAAALYVPVQFIIQFEGLARTSVSHASLMIGTLPIMLALAAVMFTDEHLDRVGWLLLAASTLGAALIVARVGSAVDSGGATLLGDVLILVSLVTAVGWVLVSQRLMRSGYGYTPEAASVYVLVMGTAMLAAVVLAREGPPPIHLSARVWIAVAEQGLLATALTTLLWNWGLHRVPAARAGIFLNLEPVVGAILGITILHETLGPLAVLGGLMIVASAVAFSQRQPEHA